MLYTYSTILFHVRDTCTVNQRKIARGASRREMICQPRRNNYIFLCRYVVIDKVDYAERIFLHNLQGFSHGSQFLNYRF